MMVNELVSIWKEKAVAQLKVPSLYFMEGTEENHETPQNSGSACRDLYPGPLRHEAHICVSCFHIVTSIMNSL
jgi:hypothetical protein